MKPAFEPTAVLATAPPAWEAVPQERVSVRVVQAAGGTLVVLALGIAIVAALDLMDGFELGAVALACATAGAVLLRAAGAMKQRRAAALGWTDESTGLYNRHGFAHAGEAMLQQARAEGRAASLVVLDFADLLEVRDIYGRETSHALQNRVVDRIRDLAGHRGLAARTGRTEFSVLLPGANRDKAVARLRSVLGNPCRIEFDTGDSEVVLVPDILCEAVADAAGAADDVYRDMAVRLADQRAREQRRQLHLQRERERHSRPMGIVSRH